MINKLKRLWHESYETKSLKILVITFLSIGILSLFASSAIGSITEEAIDLNATRIMQSILAFAATSILLLILNYAVNIYQTKVNERMRVALKSKTITSILHSHSSFRANQEQGDIIGRLDSDISSIVGAASLSVQLIRACILLAILSLGMYLIDFRILLLFIIPFPIIALLQYLATRMSIPLVLPWKVAMGETNALTQDIINNRTTIRTLQIYDRVKNWVNLALKNSADKSIRGISIFYLIVIPVAVLTVAPLFLIALGGSYFVYQGQLSIGQLISAFTLAQLATSEFNLLSTAVQNIPQLLTSTERIYPLWDAPKENFGNYSGTGIQDAPLIAFEDVSFSYPHDDDTENTMLLNHLTFSINEGDHVGLVGTSGSGKSTIFKLITRFYTPTTGTVLFRGIPIQDWNKDALRHQMAMVTQNTYLFNDSIRSNFEVVVPETNDTTIINILKDIKLDDYASADGLNMIVGERGNRLSGGQKQRLSIARAYLRNSPLLMLDEATSALDVDTEKAIQKILSSHELDQTQLVIAHRLSTLTDCDRILVMVKGKIIESGTHNDLLNHHGTYYKLYQNQQEEHSHEA
ncbi:ABC transporter ATP-binding protein [Erysipelothrix sp. HDW6C]|uniref:ABC transporter ATP-binding protein n=1 Tax=Erysipelothrix sp. HDW6C TaxID=2714930 RepID=UPI00140E7BE1|nr:ABC transporter ATP-binding protein [Erysipelothrix sp. HDW6C]QIK68792.1 ABC transporter ATP-binding protein [Erysipelothrix sp. HDW6C]